MSLGGFHLSSMTEEELSITSTGPCGGPGLSAGSTELFEILNCVSLMLMHESVCKRRNAYKYLFQNTFNIKHTDHNKPREGLSGTKRVFKLDLNFPRVRSQAFFYLKAALV